MPPDGSAAPFLGDFDNRLTCDAGHSGPDGTPSILQTNGCGSLEPQKSAMKEKSRRTWLIVSALSCSLVAALALGLKARQDGATAQTAVMLLQGSPDVHAGSVAPDADTAKPVACTQRNCLPRKVERAVARPDNPLLKEGKAFTALGDELQLKSKD